MLRTPCMQLIKANRGEGGHFLPDVSGGSGQMNQNSTIAVSEHCRVLRCTFPECSARCFPEPYPDDTGN